MSNPLLRRGLPALVLAALAVAPFVLDSYAIQTLARILVFGLLAMSVNLLTGVTGLPTLGQSAYFGIGAYTGAIVATSWTEVGIVQVVLAGLIAGAVAVPTGWVAVRARGVAFLMITLAIGEIAHTAAIRWKGITHGTDGFSGIPAVVPVPGMPALELEGLVYYYVLGAFLVLFVLVSRLVASSFGLALRGVRDNEARMRAIGYPTTRFVLAGYGLAGALAGVAGSLFTSVQRFVSPGDMGFEVAALALLAVIIGGVGSMWGAVAGAAVVILTRDYIGGSIAGHATLLLGALFVVAVYVLPRGIAGMAQWRRPLRKREAAA